MSVAWRREDDEQVDGTVLTFEHVELKPRDLHPYQSFIISLNVVNLGDRDVGKLWVRTQVNKRFQSSPVLRSAVVLASLPRDQEARVELRIKFRHDPNVNDFRFYPLAIAIVAEEENATNNPPTRTVLRSEALVLNSELLRPRLKNFCLRSSSSSGERSANILIFGDTLSGKTALAKTMMSALAGELIMNPGTLSPVGNQQHMTKHLYHASLSDGIKVLDTWGSYEGEDESMASAAFRYLVAGGLPVGWSRAEDIRISDNRLLQQLTRHQELQPDIVFFAVTKDVVGTSKAAVHYRERMKRYITLLNQERPDVQPFVVLTKIDEINDSLREDPLQHCAQLSDVIKRVAAELGVAQNTVFPTISYDREQVPNHAIDRMVLNLLYVAARIVADQNSSPF